MAKLGIYYSLCPIVDHKSLLGVNEDSESENVIVTLGKNIAVRYKLSDQKQIKSWRTKDKFSSPVLFNKEDKLYCAVFNQTILRTWNCNDENLDKLKKIKFNLQIHTILECNGIQFIVFTNGNIKLLKEAVDSCKELKPANVINVGDNIQDILTLSVSKKIYIGLLIKNSKGTYFKWTIFQGSKQEDFQTIKLERDNLALRGYVMNTNANAEINLTTLWSDGKMWSHHLKEDSANNEPTFFTLLDCLSCKEDVTIISLNEDYIAMYGANSQEDGASLIIFNIQFQILQSKQTFKMFTSGSKLWCIENHLFLSVGQSLAVIPYHLQNEQIAALIGSHKVTVQDSDIKIIQDVAVVSWEEDEVNANNTTSVLKGFSDEVQDYISQGIPESSICEIILPKYMADNNISAIEKCLECFCDIPELYITKMLNYILKLDPSCFKETSEGDNKLPPNLAPIERCHLIDKLLMFKTSDSMLLPVLRTQLEYSNAVLLLRYICYLLSEDGHSLHKDNADAENKLIDWASTVLDANYLKILLSKDENVIELLTYLNSLVSAHLCSVDELQKLVPVLNKATTSGLNKIDSLYKNYSIEQFNIYM